MINPRARTLAIFKRGFMGMVNFKESDWKAWALSLFIAICGALALIGISQNNTRLEKIEVKLEGINAKNSEQDLCMTGIKKDTEQLMDTLKTHLKDRR